MRLWQIWGVPLVGHAASAPALWGTTHLGTQAQANELVAKAHAYEFFARLQQLFYALTQFKHPGVLRE